jgi:hypothetical protein
MQGFAIALIIIGVLVVIFLLSGVGQKGGSKNQKLGVIGLIVMLLGILGLSNYVKNLDNLL